MGPRALLFLAGAALAGCGALPDLRGFSEATGELYVVTHRAGALFEGELAYAGFGKFSVKNPADPDGLELSGPLPAVFASLWAPKERAALTLSRYADALRELSAAPRTGAEKVGRLTEAVVGSFSGLGAAGLSAPLRSLAETIVETALRAKARKTMAEVVAQLDPLMQELAGLLVKDFKELEEILKDLRVQLDTLKQVDPQLKPDLERLTAAKREWVQRYKDLDVAALSGEQASKAQFVRSEIARLEAVEAASAYERAKRGVEAHLRGLKGVEKVILAWAREHARLERALSEGGDVNARELLGLVYDLKTLYEGVRR